MLSENIKRFRKKRGYSQEKLAEKAEVSLRTVQRLENGETDPTGDTLTRIAEALEVTPDDLLEWEQAEDTTYLKFLNFSALFIWIEGLLGVLIPMLLWITKRKKIKKVDKIGKDLINFQLTWLIAFLLFAILFPFLVLNTPFNIEFGFGIIERTIEEVVGLDEGSINRETLPYYLAFIINILLFYIYNTGLIIYNVLRIGKNKDVWYHPRINFMR